MFVLSSQQNCCRRIFAPKLRQVSQHLLAPKLRSAAPALAQTAVLQHPFAVSHLRSMATKVGDKVPDVKLHSGFPPEFVPGYLAKQSELKAKGVSDVLVYCVNDGAVMDGWAKDQKIEGSIISFMGDPSSELTKALGMVLDHPGPMSVLGNTRCKRFSMLVDNGVIKTVNLAEGPDDPAGDSDPSVSLVEKMLEDLA